MTEGVVRAPSAFGITLTSLAEVTLADSTTATHEFVVPRSIPITFPISSREHTSGSARRRVEMGRAALDVTQPSVHRLGPALGHHDHRRADEVVPDHVPGLDLRHHDASRVVLRLEVLDGFVLRRIEGAADGDDALYPHSLQRIDELLRHHPDALGDGLRIGAGF